ncbi:glycosyltransferase family 39 protein [Thermodesulfobacteriota bacterium]
MKEKLIDGISRPAIVAAMTILLLTPFLTKAFNIDETLFLWAARQIRTAPFDFYGFDANWYGTVMPMSSINQNPPIVSYFIALISELFNNSEITLHIAFLLPALGVTVGVFYLARIFQLPPLTASLITISSPVFLVTATTIMSDTLMLAFYLWAMIFWIIGRKENKTFLLPIAAFSICLATFTKYFGVTLIPLLIIYTVWEEQKIGTWLFYFLIPVAAIFGYEMWTNALYGHGLLLGAGHYAASFGVEDPVSFIKKTIIGFSFMGGCSPGILLLTPFLWRRQLGALATAVLCIMLFTAIFYSALFPGFEFGPEQRNLLFSLQFAVFCCTGLQILILAIIEPLYRKDGLSILISSLILGTFIFAVYLNWTTNSRSILPMIPALSLLTVRRLVVINRPSFYLTKVIVSSAVSLSLAMIIGLADMSLANNQKIAASIIHDKYGKNQGIVWYQGHWGFQYYMDSYGFHAVDFRHFAPGQGDFLIMPINNTNILELNPSRFQALETITLKAFPWASTFHPAVGAGFYTSLWGPLPYALGKSPDELFKVYMTL